MARRKASATFDAAGKRAIAAARRGSCVPAFKAAAKARKSARAVSQIVGEMCSCSSRVQTVRHQPGKAIRPAKAGTTRHTIQQLLYHVPKKSKGMSGARARRRRRR